MSEASLTCEQTTCADIPNATSSPASADGVTRSDSPAGPTTDLFGQEVVPVSRSASQASSVAAQMSATYGLRGSGSSASAALQQCLASRLQERLDSRGSTMFALTWKAKATPLRRQICQLRASALRTSDRDCGGLPTPQSMDAKGYSDALRHKFRKTGHLKHWLHGTALAIHSSSGKSSWPNPMFVEWMMGFPRLWISGHDYGLMETPSSRKSRPSS